MSSGDSSRVDPDVAAAPDGAAQAGQPTTTEHVREQAGQVAGQVGQIVEQVGQVTAHLATQAAEQVREKTSLLAQFLGDQAASRLQHQLDARRESASGGLDTLARAIGQTGEHLRVQDQAIPAEAADATAAQLAQLAGYLRTHDAAQILDEAEDFAEREPLLFLGGAVALGLLGARFLKSSQERESARSQRPSAATLGALGAALGAAAGMALPGSPQEDLLMGAARDRLLERAPALAREALADEARGALRGAAQAVVQKTAETVQQVTHAVQNTTQGTAERG